MPNSPIQTEPKVAALNSPNIQAERLAQLRRLMPDLFDGEGKLDETALQALIQPDNASPTLERFRFEWVGKHQSKRLAFAPSQGTLVMDKARSIDFESTQNLIIEGDNLEVLKLMQVTYFEKVKCIYIDPPYNTGNDFIYQDNFGESKKAYWMKNGTMKDGVRLTSISEANGRRHSNWLNMMQARILLARQLLRPDGVIFISINDVELKNLIALMNEVFGEENFIANLVWTNKEGGSGSDSEFFRIKHEYILCYAKDIDTLTINGVEISNIARYTETDEYEETRGKYYLQKLGMASIQYSPSLDYPIESPDGTNILPSSEGEGACWRWSKRKYEEGFKSGFIVFKKDAQNNWHIYTKQYLNCDNNGIIIERTSRPFGVIDKYSSIQATKALQNLFGVKIFSYPKPVDLISYLINLVTLKNENDIVLDFFSGSGTTGESVMQVNTKDDGNRKFILVQIPEYTAENSIAYSTGYKTISAMCIDRVKRAGSKIRAEHPKTPIDTGFRVFNLTESHFPENLFTPDPDKTDEENRAALETHLNAPRQQNIFTDAIFKDLVTELAIKNGFGLFYTLERLETFPANAIYRISGNDKAALLCLDKDLQEATVEQLEAHRNEQFFCSRQNLDTTKKWALQAAFKDNLWVI